MQIRVSRCGGFAGLNEDLVALDTDALDADHRAAIERLVHEADFFDLPDTLPGDSVGADQFQYSVTVIDGARQHTVSYHDAYDQNRQAETPGTRSTIARLVEMALHAS